MKPTLLLLATLTGCASAVSPEPSANQDDLTSVGGDARRIDWDGAVTVSAGASDDTIRRAIQKQVKSALGALRERSIGIADRDALSNLDPAGWTRETLNAVDTQGAVARQVVRVRYHYTDTALVAKNPLSGTELSVALLCGDYTNGAVSASLQPDCVDEASEPDSIWYHYAPARAACKRRISAEATAVAADQARLSAAPGQMAVSDADRRFLTVRAKLQPLAAAPVKYPEYDRLWGFGTDRQKVVMYAFVGVDHDLRDSHDVSAIEYQKLLRTLRTRFPGLAITETRPFAWLLDFWVDGKKLDGIGFDDVHRWMIDDAGYPAAVGTDAGKREALRQQVIDRFSERWLTWQLPVTVTRGGESRSMTVELRTYWGVEDGTETARQHATWRYLEAFWHGDVFSYTGHSHFGHGPLEPTNYTGGNFPDRYQVMLVNSCLSYNYYDLDFIAMHPGGPRNLEMVMNALPAYWNGMGEATARYLIALIDGSGKSYAQLLDSMRVNDPWGRSGYEPMRGVNGELDNVYDPAAGAITVLHGPTR